MFANQTLAIKTAERFAAQQRAKDIARNGHSNIQLPCQQKQRRRSDNSNRSSHSSSVAMSPTKSKQQPQRQGKKTLQQSPHVPTGQPLQLENGPSTKDDERLIRGGPKLPSLSSQNTARTSINISTSNTTVSAADDCYRIVAARSSAPTAESVHSASSSSSTVQQSNHHHFITNWRDRKASALFKALAKLDDALELQQSKLDGIADGISRHTALAKARLGYSNNSMGALLSMRTVKALQYEHMNVGRLVDGLNQIQENLELGFIDKHNLNAVDKAIDEVVRVPFPKQRRHATDEELLHELQQIVDGERSCTSDCVGERPSSKGKAVMAATGRGAS